MGDPQSKKPKTNKPIDIEKVMKTDNDAVINNFKAGLKKDIFPSDATKNNSTSIINDLRNRYMNLTLNLGKGWHPYVNGRYMIIMNHGPWLNDIKNLKNKNNFNISKDTIEYFNSNNNFNRLYTTLATDIDLPSINNEYINLSTRNQAITYFLRQSSVPDFSISYIENHLDIPILQYHDAWFKALELYRRGSLNFAQNSSRKNKYFYDVPYLNGAWVVIFDIAMEIRGLIYLVGIKPVNHPLKEFLGNRSNNKMTVYNIQYKTTGMHHIFFKNTKSFINQLNDLNSTNKKIGSSGSNDTPNKSDVLLKQFRKMMSNISGSSISRVGKQSAQYADCELKNCQPNTMV